MTNRPIISDDDAKIDALLMDYRGAGYVHIYPTIWRLRLLINSRLWDRERDTWLWEDDVGNAIGFALLWKRSAGSMAYVLERIMHPDADLSSEMLDWAIERAKTAALEFHKPSSLAAMPLEKNIEQDMRLLESKDFSRVLDEHNVYMAIKLPGSAPSPAVPEGFRLQVLEENDVELYRGAYGFTAVSAAHQRELLHQPEYQHFVIRAPDDSFAAYLECSLSKAEWALSQQVENGWIDYIQTQNAFQRIGLGRALMLAGFHHLQAQGADTIMLLTASNNVPALSLYGRVGMRVAVNESVYVMNDIGG